MGIAEGTLDKEREDVDSLFSAGTKDGDRPGPPLMYGEEMRRV